MKRWATPFVMSLLIVGCARDTPSSSPPPTTAAPTTTAVVAPTPPLDVRISDPWVNEKYVTAKYAVNVSWRKPASSGSTPIVGYEVFWGPEDVEESEYDHVEAVVASSLFQSQIVSGLKPAETYRFLVAVRNQNNQRVYSSPTSRTIVIASSTASSCSLDDEGRELVREWNRVSAELLNSFHVSDPADPTQYIADSGRLLPKLNRIVQDLRHLRECLPAYERVVFTPFLGTYDDKLSGYLRLSTAARLDSGVMAQTALETLMAANAESVGMACEIARITGVRLPGVDVC